ncbi:FAD-binding oxidoreductase [Nonomuraea roseoviolacea]|uniref:FAD/FMN-containing dehydrogenase n=1 Tax=Nonomuraea roseoviolacea subsp. carminata TaxID=160689 RepID=A0ABT1KD46_9ACTN|nr:FAD-binding oxidoreductase [Nonomuraea roseoviolacea]MCP2351944.1 FAD/FMN-containing dehydrogenase [Nonomuraea roseoviolacea subsp. carminata]
MSAGGQAGELELVRRGDPGYEEVRAGMVWNARKPARSPEVIVRAADERDVARAVRLARSAGMPVAVRAGGHNWIGCSLREGGMLIDLSRLRGCAVDAASGTAVVGPAVTGRELAAALAGRDLAFPVGHCGSVAVGGYLTSGGLGWNPGAWGPACGGVVGVEAVTADGELVRCDERDNADLFWAARGAGAGLFAVVTRFRLALRRAPAVIVRSAYVFALEEVERVASWVEEVAAVLPAPVELSVIVGTQADGSGRKVVSVTATCFAGSREEAGRSLEAFAACPWAGRALERTREEPVGFDALLDASDGVWRHGDRCAADTLWSERGLAAVLPPLARELARAPSDRSLVLASPAPAGPGRGAADMAFSVLGSSYVVGYAIWDDPADDAANEGWLRTAMDGVAPLGSGHYIAETDLLAGPDRVRRSFAPAAWERLGRLRGRWDPDGVFAPFPREAWRSG